MSTQRDLSASLLQVIFSIFLGLVVTAFIGIGVNTFFPDPESYDSSADWDGHRLTTSIILLVCATAVMLVSLAIATAGPVIANGALLGGLFTMVYAVGIGLSAGNQWPRFAVLALALAVTVAVGWWKFTRAPKSAPPPAGPVPGGLDGAAEARLSAVEAKLDALGRALRD